MAFENLLSGIRAVNGLVESTAYNQRGVDLSGLLPPSLSTETNSDLSLWHYDSPESILRPVVIEGIPSEPFGKRPIGAREFEALKQEGRLAAVLRATLDNVGAAFPSMTHWLAIEMCKMDGGLNGPDRTLILDLAASAIRGDRLGFMRHDDWGDKLIDALNVEDRLVPLLAEIIEGRRETPMRTMAFPAMILLVEVLQKEGERDDRRKPQLVAVATQLIAQGGYREVERSTLDAIGHKQVLALLRKRTEDHTHNKQDKFNFLEELEHGAMSSEF